MIPPKPNLVLPAPPTWLRVHAILLIGGCAVVLADSALALAYPRSPFEFLGATCLGPFVAVVAWLQYSAVFRRRPGCAVAASSLCFLTSLLMACAVVEGVLGPLTRARVYMLLLAISVAAYAGAAGVINMRWSRRAAPRPWWICRCGYDLRATPERCPECGVVPTAQPARLSGMAP